MLRSFARFIGLPTLAVLLSCPTVFAQGLTGAIEGTVSDGTAAAGAGVSTIRYSLP